MRNEAIKPKDPRVKSLWDLLRQRQLLRRSPWLKAVLRRIWIRGCPLDLIRARRIGSCSRLRRWGMLPPKSVRAPAHRPTDHAPFSPSRMQAMRPVALKPVASVRPAAMQPVRPVQMQPAAMKAAPK